MPAEEKRHQLDDQHVCVTRKIRHGRYWYEVRGPVQTSVLKSGSHRLFSTECSAADHDAAAEHARRQLAEYVAKNRPPAPTELTDSEKLAVDMRDVIGAIKLIRSRSGCGLADAKALVDAYRYPPNHQGVRNLELLGRQRTEKITAVEPYEPMRVPPRGQSYEQLEARIRQLEGCKMIKFNPTPSATEWTPYPWDQRPSFEVSTRTYACGRCGALVPTKNHHVGYFGDLQFFVCDNQGQVEQAVHSLQRRFRP